MKFLSIFSLAVAAQAATASLRASIPKVDGLEFSIDGKTKYLAGTNAYWLPYLTKNSDIDLVFQHLSQSGLNLLRTWGFNDVNTVPSGGEPMDARCSRLFRRLTKIQVRCGFSPL